jgi:hypothetical protein
VLQTQSQLLIRTQRNAFWCRDVRLQSRLFARWNQSLKYSSNTNRPCSDSRQPY